MWVLQEVGLFWVSEDFLASKNACARLGDWSVFVLRVLPEEGLFEVSEDLALSIRCPLAVELEALFGGG